MTRSVLWGLCVAVLLCLAAQSLWSQQEAPVYASTYCFKVLPGKAADFERFVSDAPRKRAQLAIDERRLSSWGLSRAVAPTGETAACDYVMMYSYSGPPPEPQSDSAVETSRKKAGIKLTAEQVAAQWAALCRLVGHARTVRYAGFGTVEKGDYYHVNYMKARPGKATEFRNFERKVWMPAAQEAAKTGHPRKGWSAWYVQYPGGTAAPYDDVTVDVFTDWASIWKPQTFSKEIMDRMAPGKTIAEINAQMVALRDLTGRQLYIVADLLRRAPAK